MDDLTPLAEPLLLPLATHADYGAGLVFVLGMVESGMPLVRNALAGHAACHVGADPGLMPHLVYGLRWEGIETDYNAFQARTRLERWFAELPGGRDTYVESLRTLAVGLYHRVREKAGRPFLVDASPRNFHAVPELIEIFPEARYIVVVRNPASLYAAVLETQCGNSLRTLKQNDDVYRELYAGPRQLAAALHLLGDKALVVHYEYLIGNPESVGQGLEQHLGLPGLATLVVQQVEAAVAAMAPVEFDVARLLGDYCGGHCAGNDTPPFYPVAAEYLDHLGPATLRAWGYVPGDLLGLRMWQLLGERQALPFLAPCAAQLEGLGVDPALVWGGATETAEARAALAEALNERGEALHAQGGQGAAASEEAFTLAARLAPSDPRPINNLGVLCWNAGVAEAALACFAEALRVDRGYHNGTLNLAALLDAVGRQAEAKSLLTQALLESPDHPGLMQAYLQL